MRAAAPVLPLGDAEPAFLLQEVEEHDLAHEFLGKVTVLTFFAVNSSRMVLSLATSFSSALWMSSNSSAYWLKNSLVTASTLKASSMSASVGSVLGVLEQAEKTGLRGVAALAFADDVGETARGGEVGFHADLAGFFLDGGVFHLDIGEPPLCFPWARRTPRGRRPFRRAS